MCEGEYLKDVLAAGGVYVAIEKRRLNIIGPTSEDSARP